MTQPKPNKLVKVKCYDWSPYEVEGMFIMYKPGSPKKMRHKARFCRKDEFGEWQADKESWSDMESWEYIDDPKSIEQEGK